MARHRIPQVIDGHLQLLDDTDGFQSPILVGSATWYAWLKEETVQSFAFHSAQGPLTVRRERSHGNWYWYAYRTQQGQLHKAYLGKLEELTSERLHEIAATLVTNTSSHQQELDANVVTSASISSGPSTGTTTSQYNETLLATKLFIPPPTATLIARPRLFAQLTASTRGSLTLITAPVGWGKTTLLSAWHTDPNSSSSPVAWVSLDVGDNDPTRFWTYVITALNTLYFGIGEAALTLLRSTHLPQMESVLTTLLNNLINLPKDGVLVLDDYHVIESQSIHAAFAFLLEHLPPWLHLVITTRLDPPFPLARLRARGALTEIRAVDLRFTSEEAAAFLTEVMGLPLSSEQVDALEEGTEGWIAGLHLAALSAKGRSLEHLAHFVEAFTGSNRFVLEYLTEEVLGQQTDEVQTFLLYTSVLDRLCAPLCDAVLSAGQAELGKTEAGQTQPTRAMLEYLERANLFLIPLDDERRWYRYHHLFTDVLRSRLKQNWPTLVPELHRRASTWYEQNEMLADAVQHALAGADFERAADLIEQSYHAIAVRGQVHMVLGWLNMLPDYLVRTRPLLCIYQADMLMHTKRLEAVEARLQDAERCLEAEMPDDQRRMILGLTTALRAILVRYTGDFERSVAFAHQALKLLPEAINFGRVSAMVSAAHTYLVSGDVTPVAERLVAGTLAPARALGDFYVLSRSIALLARMHVLQGQLGKAATTYEEVVRVIPEQNILHALSSSAAYYFGLGDVLREWNQLDEASRYLMDGMKLMQGTQTVFANDVTLGYLALARLQLARGEYGRAIATLETFAQVAHERHFVLHLLARGAAVRARIELVQGNLVAAIRWADASVLSVNDDLNYLREMEYLTLARVLVAQGRDTANGPFLRDALHLLERLLDDAEGKVRMGSVIEILALRALASQAQGDDIGARAALERAVTLAEVGGYMRLFLDEGEPMLALLSKLLASGHHARAYLQRILAAGDSEPGHGASPIPASVQISSRPPLIDPLSARELEVMHLMVTGASNNEIAERLVVAVSTVKRHVSNIFSKLAVANRTQAVARAREIGLL